MKLAGHLLDYVARKEESPPTVERFRELIEIIRESRVHSAETVIELEAMLSQVRDEIEDSRPPSLYPARANHL